MDIQPLKGFTTAAKFADEDTLIARLVAEAALSENARAAISKQAADLVRRIRASDKPSLMEEFLAEYGLSTREGVALMCLAESMLRVPDADTIDALIEDKIAPSDWGKHLGEASSSLVNASTWALMLTGRVLNDGQPGIAGLLHGAIKRLGEPVIRRAVSRAMKEMGRQFVLGETIAAALHRAETEEAKGYTYSYDMLGEAALTEADAQRYFDAYAAAIRAIAQAGPKGGVEMRPGISIKLSALHPRYELMQEARVMRELVPRVRQLARMAKAGGMGLNIDAEEQARLTLSLKVIRQVLADPGLAGWDGFGVVVQAYGKRAGLVIDWLYDLAQTHDRRLMVRLVKGAYWDSEMKHAQVEGHPGFPLFTTKTATDVSYITLAKKLFAYSDRLYPQFATHNAHSVAAVLELAEGRPFEFQRLHGMGERLHDLVLSETGGRCRIYAPVGAHRDLLAYLVRRLLENGANSSFVNQIVDEDVSPETIAADPFARVTAAKAPQALRAPSDLFGTDRRNSTGFDLSDEETLCRIEAERPGTLPDAGPRTVTPANAHARPVHDPASGMEIGQVHEADAEITTQAIADARVWQAPVAERAAVLRRAAEAYEAHYSLIFATLAREAGKTWADAVGELREAVDFLSYYAAEAERQNAAPAGIFAAISPWNFPLAIFTGQIAAALAAGNAVLAKPAEQTPLIAALAVRLLHEAGVPETALQLLPGPGETVGATLSSDPRISGVVFTGSTETALRIRQSMAAHLDPGATLIAETGGLNAMIVDSTALPEQAVRDIVASAFQSAGQRCSALRCLYLQREVAPHVIEMIKGAMDELSIGNGWQHDSDLGPVIDREAQANIIDYVTNAAMEGRILHQVRVPRADISTGHFVPPTLISVPGIEALTREVFGPVLHVATFEADDLDQVIQHINNSSYGLTFGLHTRIDSRVQHIADRIAAGNIYVNRNQIGAVVGSQPFGGEGLSGTGPKAGGPRYLSRFVAAPNVTVDAVWDTDCDLEKLKGALTAHAGKKAVSPAMSQTELPGPTGESNTLHEVARSPLLCLGPGAEAVAAQIKAAEAQGGQAIGVEGALPAEALTMLDGFSGVIWWGADAGDYAVALSQRQGPILPLITGMPDAGHVRLERHLCIDTTAAGGNAALLAG